MDVFWKGYYTFGDLARRWDKNLEEISAAVLSRKLIPSYFLREGDARDVCFVWDDDEDGRHFSIDDRYHSSEQSGKFVFLRYPVRTSLTQYSFSYGCDSPFAAMEDFRWDTWYRFKGPITSSNEEIVFLRSQVESFEKTYLPSLVRDEADRPSLYPWGDHNTRLLQKLSDAATALWSRYDPLDPSTAPTNEQVTDWLIERNVPKRVAQTMATILRADGLRMGRRKL